MVFHHNITSKETSRALTGRGLRDIFKDVLKGLIRRLWIVLGLLLFQFSTYSKCHLTQQHFKLLTTVIDTAHSLLVYLLSNPPLMGTPSELIERSIDHH